MFSKLHCRQCWFPNIHYSHDYLEMNPDDVYNAVVNNLKKGMKLKTGDSDSSADVTAFKTMEFIVNLHCSNICCV